jgi:hypothetical protein
MPDGFPENAEGAGGLFRARSTPTNGALGGGLSELAEAGETKILKDSSHSPPKRLEKTPNLSWPGQR